MLTSAAWPGDSQPCVYFASPYGCHPSTPLVHAPYSPLSLVKMQLVNRQEMAITRRPVLFLSITLAVAAVYFGAGKVGLSLASLAEQITLVWPPTGIALAAVLLFGYRVWPGIALGAFLVNVASQEPPLVAAGIALGNSLEALIGAVLLQRLISFRNTLERLKDALGLIILAAILTTAVSASVGVAALCLGRLQPWTAYPYLWSEWWLGDAMGNLVIAPVILSWASLNRARWNAWRIAEALALSVGLTAVSAIVFLAWGVAPVTDYPFEYAVFPFVIWAALRLGQVGSSSATCIALAIAVGGTVHGSGPFARPNTHTSLIVLQIYMAVVAVTALLLSAAMTERRSVVALLREGDRRKNEFLAMLAHELRNPLAPLRNALHVLRLPTVTSAEAEQMRDMMERQVHHLVRLVDDLLDVSRIMRGKVELRKGRLDLAAVIAQAVETARPLLEARNHNLTVIPPPQPVLLEGDMVRLCQVLANVLHNAAKYTEPGGTICISGAREKNLAVVRVRDNGIGIDPELVPHIFDLFVQANKTTARAQGGLGIGLTLSRQLVEMHGGTIVASSEGQGQGSEFVVQLPLLAERDADVPGTPKNEWPPVPGGRALRVLVVDDDRDAGDSLAFLLRLQGHQVRVAREGPAALEMAGSDPPELVFLDLGMPGMDGYEVARRLRRLPKLANTMLVALTGWGREEDRLRTREAGFDHHLTKPAEPETLQKLLALAGKRSEHAHGQRGG
jgi:signal transduction histidine kinase/ActR/RegA family two-component response regulator